MHRGNIRSYKRRWMRIVGVISMMILLCFNVSNTIEAEEEIAEAEIAEEAIERLPELYDENTFESADVYATKTLLVQLKEGTELEFEFSINTAIELGNDFYILNFDTEDATKDAYAYLEELDDILSVEIDSVTALSPAIETEKNEEESENWLAIIEELHGFSDMKTEIGDGGKSVTIALIDTLVEAENQRIQDSVIVFDDEESEVASTGVYAKHGEILASLLLDYTTEQVDILPITAFNTEGESTVLSVYLGIMTAIEHNVDVINLSFCGIGNSSILEYAVQEAIANNIVVIVAAGNDGGDVNAYMPANIEQAITVGAVDDQGEITKYSNTGIAVDIVAYEGYSDGDEWVTGTSVSAAYVSAAAALLCQMNSNGQVSIIEAELMNGAFDVGEEGKDNIYGGGVLSLFNIEDEEYEIECEQSDELAEAEAESESESESVNVENEVLFDENDMQQKLEVAMSTQANVFYWSSSLGNRGEGVIEYNGEIYWCNRAYRATTNSYKYDNLGWYVQMKNYNGTKVTFYVLEEDCLIDTYVGTNYDYYLYKISRTDLVDAVGAAGHDVEDYFSQDVTIELDGNVRICLNGSTVAGPYDLRYTSRMNSLVTTMESYGFSSSSITTVQTQLQNKILVIEGSDILLTYAITYATGTADTVSNMPSDGIKYYNVAYTLPSNVPTRAGYTFLYWQCSKYANVQRSAGGSITNNEDRIFTAVWSKDEIKEYTISYKSGTTDTVSNMPADAIKYENEAYTVSSKVPLREGYIFKYWLCSTYNNAQYPGESIFYTNQNRVLTAVWEKTYASFIYNVQGVDADTGEFGIVGNISEESIYDANTSGWAKHESKGLSYHVVYYGENLGTGGLMDPEELGIYAEGYSIVGWVNYSATNWSTSWDSANVVAVFDFVTAYDVGLFRGTSNNTISDFATEGNTFGYINLFPVYQAAYYDVIYDANGGSVTPESEVIKKDDIIVLPVPERDGYSFKEWRVAEDGTTYAAGEKVTITSDITFVAQWDGNPELIVADVYMYLEDEIDIYRFYKEVSAIDEEDGDITQFVTFNQEKIEEELERLKTIELEADEEYQVRIEYTVLDSYGHEVTEEAILYIYAIFNETNVVLNGETGYVRFISEDYIETLHADSVWRETEVRVYLESILLETS